MKNIAVIFMVALQLAVGRISANAQSSSGSYTVTVNAPGTFEQVMLQTHNGWSDILELYIIGSLDSCDMNCFSKMDNIEKLDLSQTDIVKIHGCADLKKLHSVNLPTSVIEVADSAFAGCSALSDINLDSVNKIGDYGFIYCRGIKNVTASKLQSIGSSSFWGCNQLETVVAPHVITVGESAFCDCNRLKEFDFSSVKYLDYNSFGECYNLQEAIIPNLEALVSEEHSLGHTFIRCRSLKNVYLGEKIKEIPSYTFYECSGLSTVKIPSSVRSIGQWAFGYCHMTELEIPEGIKELNKPIYSGFGLETLVLPSSLKTLKIQDGMEGTIFGSSHRLKDLTCKSAIPLSETGLDDRGLGNATLHVPAFAVNNYENSEVWNSFGSIEPLNEEFSRIEIDSYFNLSCSEGISENAELILTNRPSEYHWANWAQFYTKDPAAHLTFSADKPLKINRFMQIQNWALKDESIIRFNPYSTTLIASNGIVADTIELKLTIRNFEWNFISFPFDVSVDDISLPENTSWIIRQYSGQNRAAMSNDSWQDLQHGMILHAYEGYIIHASLTDTNGYNYYSGPFTVDMKVIAADNRNKNKIFASDNVLIPLKDYPSEFGHNQSWNLIGNPYPCYYDICGLDFSAPLTVWDGATKTYNAVSPVDDIYVLRPNEAFFVQKPNQVSSLEFECGKRLHTINEIYESQHYSSSPNSRGGNYMDRMVYNFYISNEDAEDKTRLVLNEFAKPDYELEHDASKFLSFESTTPQIFNYQDGVRYAINERPADSEGYYLGIYVGFPGEYTLRMDCRTMDTDVYLTDMVTGGKVNLTHGSYTFISDKGCFDRRFKVVISRKNSEPSSINTITTDCDTTESEIYNLKGQWVNGSYKGFKIVNGKKSL